MSATVREVMRAPVETIDARATLQDAAAKMRDLGVGFLPVLEDGRLSGVVTDRDIAVRAVSYGVANFSTPVSEVATREVISCRPGQSVSYVQSLMAERLVRRIVVVDEDNRPVGIVALDDLARLRGAEAGRVLEQLTEPDAHA